jgi:hypothetical protein
VHQIAIGAARFGGVFFVILGALGTLMYTNALFGSHQLGLRASSYDSMQTTSTCTSSGSGSYEEQCGTMSTASTAYQPPASFDINHPDALAGTVQVRIKVPSATAITLSAYSKTQSRDVTLGRPSKVSDDTWEYSWNTTQYDDGDYRLHALISNSSGTYDSENGSYVTVVNHPITSLISDATDTLNTDTLDSTSGSDTSSGSGSGSDSTSSGSDSSGSGSTTDTVINTVTTTTSSTTTAVSTAASTVSVTLSADTREASTFVFTMQNPSNTDTARVYATNRSTKKDVLLGYAYKADSRVWKYRWLSSGYAEGDYDIRAIATVSGRDYVSDTLRVKVVSSQTATTQTGTTTTSLTATNSGPSSENMAPKASVSILKNSPLSGTVDIRVDVENAASVEISALSRTALTPRYLGLAKLVNKNTWIYTVDTRSLPNADYKFLAQVRNGYGTYSGESSYATVKNIVTTAYTEDQQKTVNTLTQIASSTAPVPQTVEKTIVAPVASIDASTSSTHAPVPAAQANDPTEKILEDSGKSLDAELQRYAAALRSGDTQGIETTKERLAKMQNEIIPAGAEGDLAQKVSEHVSNAMKRVEEDVDKTNKIIAERTPEKAVLDSDKDGITDFDEVNIFNTDPFIADTDGDGFTDGAEILSGYDPKDATSEASVAFESPKESGVVREDILSVDSIATAAPVTEAEAPTPVAVISGKALPNSFVTLYIFSTPVVVTVKTQEDGSWSYRFDKEIENGQHEVYVGITDNAGKIVAKSNPLTFVKEAQAFTVTDAKTEAPEPVRVDEPSLISRYAIYLVLSVSVVAIGLLLILLGLHLDGMTRRRLIPEEVPGEAV